MTSVRPKATNGVSFGTTLVIAGKIRQIGTGQFSDSERIALG